MLREELIDALTLCGSSDCTEEQEGYLLWWMHKSLPHVNLWSMWKKAKGTLTLPDIVDDAMRLEAERVSEPIKPLVSEEMLLDNIAYLQYKAKDLGEKNLYILIPLDLEYPHAYLPEMIWQTHVDSTPEEIVAELHRRQAAAGVEGGGAGQGRTPLPPRWLREAGA